MTWIVGAGTQRGESHDTNEDAVLIEWIQNGDGSDRSLLLAVADGMGGLEGGQEASSAAIAALLDGLREGGPREGALTNAFAEAHARIWRLGSNGRKRKRMGTTLVAAVLEERRLVVANVGDSRAYMMKSESLVQLTSDHSASGEQVLQGLLTKDEAARSPYTHLLTRCLGVNEQAPEVDVFEYGPLQSDGWLLLCSDGLYSLVDEAEIGRTVSLAEPHGAAQALIDLVLRRGAPDDVSAIVVKRRALDR